MTSLSFENFKISKLYLLSASIYSSAPSRSNNPVGKSVLFTRSRSPKIVLTRTLCQSLLKLKTSILCSSHSSRPRALLSAVPKKKSALKYPARLKNRSKTRQLETIIPQNENLWKLQRTILERASRLVAQRVTVDREREKFVEKSEYGLRVCPFETGKNLAACNGTCVRACMRAWVSKWVSACVRARRRASIYAMWCDVRRGGDVQELWMWCWWFWWGADATHPVCAFRATRVWRYFRSTCPGFVPSGQITYSLTSVNLTSNLAPFHFTAVRSRADSLVLSSSFFFATFFF